MAKHVQWVYVPAVKDARDEQAESKNTALGKLLSRTVRATTNFAEEIGKLRGDVRTQYQSLLAKNQAALEGISKALTTRLAEWAHPEARLKLEWFQDPDKSVRIEEPWAHAVAGEGEFDGELARLGHGFQRSYLLALLQALAAADDSAQPTLILACEEPELYQHPPQMRHLSDVLRKLGGGGAQVVVSTHSPLFVSGQEFDGIRMIRKTGTPTGASVTSATVEAVEATVTKACDNKLPKPKGNLMKIHQALQPALNEMFFAERVVLVEGLEDIAYLTTYLHLTGLWDEYRRFSCHIVSADAKSKLIRPIAIAKAMKIPTFVIFDADGNLPPNQLPQHEQENGAILKLTGHGASERFPTKTLWQPDLVMWPTCFGRVVEEDIGETKWRSYQQSVEALYGHPAKAHKASLFVADVLMAAWEDGVQSESLKKLCQWVLAFAKGGSSLPVVPVVVPTPGSKIPAGAVEA